MYSPNATWSKVKSATINANIVIYMGHGNGWPSPYTYDPNYTTKDGFGLNATAGNGDNNVKYYGEPYVDDLALAPNAIILLHHLCYASGNSEPGNAEGTVDHDGQGSASTTTPPASCAQGPCRHRRRPHGPRRTTCARCSRRTSRSCRCGGTRRTTTATSSTSRGARSSGRPCYMDPDDPGKNFYRSPCSGRRRSRPAMSPAWWRHGVDPATFVVPGRASVGALGAELLGDETGLVAGALDDGPPEARLGGPTGPPRTALACTRWRVSTTNRSPASSARRSSSRATARHPSWSPSTRCRPPSPRTTTDSFDTTDLSAQLLGERGWTLRVNAGDGTVVRSTSGTGQEPASSPGTALIDGAAVADGTYTYTFSGWTPGRTRRSRSRKSGHGQGRHDAARAVGRRPGGRCAAVVLAQRRRSRDTFALKASTNESGRIEVGVRNDGGELIRTFSTTVSAGAFSIPWDGRNNDGAVVPDGTYDIRLVPVDRVPIEGASETVSVRSIALLGAVDVADRVLLQDRDSLGSTSVLSFAINREATVTWTIRNAAGDVVDTHRRRDIRGAGTTRSPSTADRRRWRPAAAWEVHVARDRDRRYSHGQPERRLRDERIAA